MKILRLPAVEEKLGVKSSTIWKYVREMEGFPRPISIGPRAVGWSEQEIDAWLEAQAAKRKAA